MITVNKTKSLTRSKSIKKTILWHIKNREGIKDRDVLQAKWHIREKGSNLDVKKIPRYQ